MDDEHKTKAELIQELQQLRKHVADLDTATGHAVDQESVIDVLTKYELLAAIARDVILFVRARDGRILEANRAAEDIYGYTRAEFLKLTIYDLRAPSTRQGIAVQMNQADLHGITFETIHRRRDGQEFPVEVNSGGVTLGADRILLSIVRDISERKQAEDQREDMLEALRQSEERFSKSFFNAPVAVCLTRAADGRFFEVNERFLDLLEYSRSDVIGHTTLELDMYPDPNERAILLGWLSQQGFVRDHEITFRARTGALRQVLLSSVPVKLNEEDCILASLVDITERKQMETALQELNATLEERVQARTAELQIATNRLLELDRLKDEFVSRINHELRTPLANVRIYADLLEHGLPEKRSEYLQTFQRQTDRLHKLIEDLLKVRQITSEFIELEITPLNLNHLIEEHLEAWGRLAARRALEFKIELAPDLPPVLTDSNLIGQVITHIVQNAVSYTRQGQIVLSTALQSKDRQRWATLRVADTGPGIASDELPHIFERFYRGRAASDYRTPGTGVGLSISQDLMSLLGGQITVESEVERGSIFTLWLPLAPEL